MLETYEHENDSHPFKSHPLGSDWIREQVAYETARLETAIRLSPTAEERDIARAQLQDYLDMLASSELIWTPTYSVEHLLYATATLQGVRDANADFATINYWHHETIHAAHVCRNRIMEHALLQLTILFTWETSVE